MFRSSRRSYKGIDAWPGFVDAMATLLMVIIFVLMTFVLAQFYLTDAITNKDENLALLDTQVATLNNQKAALENEKQKAHAKINLLQSSVEDLTKKLEEAVRNFDSVSNNLTLTAQQKAEGETTITLLTEKSAQLQVDINDLKDRIAAQDSILSAHVQDIHKKESDLAEKSAALDQLTHELLGLTEKITGLQQSYDYLNQEHTLLQKENLKFKGSMVAYRSEFFAILQKTVGNRADVRVVGDRFVFQSEVLFKTGSADLGAEGKQQLNTLVTALKEITEKIPPSLNWILRVDGHTDQVPISTPFFPSNWELSLGRAMSVVRYLISQGISPKNLVPAGFGQFQPLEDSSDMKAQARNRRIEFKLDQR